MTRDRDAEALRAARAPRPSDVDTLRRRAAALGRQPRAQDADTTVPVVVFTLGAESYALDARVVLQVATLVDLTPLPGAAPPLFGVTQWRGDVLTILDLRGPLGVRIEGLTDLGRVIVVDGPDRAFGILADSAREVSDLDSRAIRPLPAEDAAGRPLLSGITDAAVLVIDPAALLHAYGTHRDGG